jgi:DNA-binding PadR family transcriptional regulator
MVKLTPTARVVLGMVKLGARTGYDIKRATDLSTRFFWGASYGQIYPELRRLTEAGLLRAADAPRGALKRTVYELTPAGESALHEWLTRGDWGDFELRDEALLRFFFGDLLSRDEVVANLRVMRRRHEEIRDRFRAMEADARDGFAGEGQIFPYLALRYGIAMMGWIADWCAETERRLEAGDLP